MNISAAEAFVWEIGERLKPVFPYFKKELIRDVEALGRLVPAEMANRWKFISEE